MFASKIYFYFLLWWYDEESVSGKPGLWRNKAKPVTIPSQWCLFSRQSPGLVCSNPDEDQVTQPQENQALLECSINPQSVDPGCHSVRPGQAVGTSSVAWSRPVPSALSDISLASSWSYLFLSWILLFITEDTTASFSKFLWSDSGNKVRKDSLRMAT